MHKDLQAIHQIWPVAPEPQTKPQAPAKEQGDSFQKVLEETAGQENAVRFSKHALDRLESRQVDLGLAELDRLNDAVKRAGDKGAEESVVFLDELAFVVSVKNKMVITALQSGKDNVFTKIDSAVIA